MVGNKHWTESEREHIRQHYAGIKNTDLGQLLDGRSEKAIRDQAGRMGIKKCQERLEEMGRENCLRRYAFKQPPKIQG